jgi:beta-phosphoglucomutase-like phosphatase (HAD superfamily)
MTDRTNQPYIPGLGPVVPESGLLSLEGTSDGRFLAGRDGVRTVWATGDRKVELVAFDQHSLAHVTSALGYPAYYPLHPASVVRPIEAVLMDLDGTSVRSEGFWVWVIERTIASLLGDPAFRLRAEDDPYVSGHSVSEHLDYVLRKYCQHASLEAAKSEYYAIARLGLAELAAGRGRQDEFVPAPGLKPFLLGLKARGIKIALVTSGLYEKAWPEIVAAFGAMRMGDPADFYDAIITAGFPLRAGQPGTLGELSPKPHPWLYAEAALLGLGISFERRHAVIGIEDSGAGVCAVRLAGFSAVGMAGGNVIQSGTRSLCESWCRDFQEVMAFIDGA